MDSSLLTLLNQKKSVFKTLSLKASELSLTKSFRTDSNITCNRLICDVIEINPGVRQELKDVDIIDSSINSTEIGTEEPSIGKFTKLEITSLSSPEESFKTDGDIHISGVFLDIERQLKSDNPFKLNALSTLDIESIDKMKIKSFQDINLDSLNTIFMNSNVSLDFTTKKLNINSNLNLNNQTDSSYYDNGSFVLKGGLGVHKNISVGGNLTVYNQYENSIRLFGGMYVKKNINIEGSLNVVDKDGNNLNVGGSAFVIKNMNVFDSVNILGNSSDSLLVSGGITAKSNVLIEKNLNVNQTINTNNLKINNNLQAQIGLPINNFNISHHNLNLSSKLFIPDSIQKIDHWITKQLIDTPPQPENTNNQIITTVESITFDWIIPNRFDVGFLNQKVPLLISLGIDYKKSTESEYTNIIINDLNINKLNIYAFNSQNTINNNIYNLYNIEKEIEYDFRIYYINHNNKNNTKYLHFKNLKTLPFTLPPIINNIRFNNITSNSININWDHPISNSKIESYKIQYNSIDSIKYPNFINNNNTLFINTNNIFINANNNFLINNLLEGHTYSLNISFKNRITNNYSPSSNNISFTTNINFMNFNINNSNLFINNNQNYIFNNQNYGYSLDGNTLVNNLFDYDKLDNHIETNILNNLRINENISTIQPNTTILTSTLNNYKHNLNLGGFGINNITNNINNNLNIIVLDENNNNGFFKTSNIKININKNILNQSNIKKSLQLNQYLPFSQKNYKSQIYDFHIDKVNNISTVSNLNTSLLDYKLEYISGVPIFLDANLNVNLITHNLTNNFLRHDKKHLEIMFLNNNNNIFNDKININNDYIKNQNNYYNINESLHNDGKTLIKNTEKLLFKNIKLKLNNNNDLGYSEKLKLGIHTFNLYGKSDLNKFNFNSKIRIDYNSIVIKNNLTDSNQSTGKHVFSGGNTIYPYIYTTDTEKYNIDLNNLNLLSNNYIYNYSNVLNNEINYNNYLNVINNIASSLHYNINLIHNPNILINFNLNKDKIDKLHLEYNNNINNLKLFSNDYDHTKNIKYMNELQLIDGMFQTLNNTNYNLDNDNSIIYPNYNITDLNLYEKTVYDFITLKYTNIINNINKITIEIFDSNIDSNNDILIMIKIINNENSNYNTAWLDANKYISMMGVNDYNKNINGTGILSIYNKESQITKKYCYLPNGSKGILYVRVGIKKNSKIKFKYIKVLQGFI